MMMSSSSFVVASHKKPRERGKGKKRVDLDTLNYCETPNETENESLNIPLSFSCFFLSLFPFDATFFLDAQKKRVLS